MNGAELFRTLTGKEAQKPVLDVLKDAQAAKRSESAEGGRSDRDVFVCSSKNVVPETDSFERLMEYDNDLNFRIAGGMTKEQLATHFGDMGKRLDEAYANGKFTEAEYNDLNAGLLESYDKAITRCELKAASYEVYKENARARQAQAAGEMTAIRRNKTNIEKILEAMGVQTKDSGTLTEEEAERLHRILVAMENAAEEREEEEETSSADNDPDNSEEEDFSVRIKKKAEQLRRQEEEFAAKYCRTDRAEMLKMLDTVRRGGELSDGRDNSYGTLKTETWFTDGYVAKPYY